MTSKTRIDPSVFSHSVWAINACGRPSQGFISFEEHSEFEVNMNAVGVTVYGACSDPILN